MAVFPTVVEAVVRLDTGRAAVGRLALAARNHTARTPPNFLDPVADLDGDSTTRDSVENENSRWVLLAQHGARAHIPSIAGD